MNARCTLSEYGGRSKERATGTRSTRLEDGYLQVALTRLAPRKHGAGRRAPGAPTRGVGATTWYSSLQLAPPHCLCQRHARLASKVARHHRLRGGLTSALTSAQRRPFAMALAGDGSSAFSRALASNSRKQRDAALFALTQWLGARASVEESDLMKIWKGQFYAMWHADKAPVQARGHVRSTAARRAACFKHGAHAQPLTAQAAACLSDDPSPPTGGGCGEHGGCAGRLPA